MTTFPALPVENEPAVAARVSAETLTLLAQRRSTKVIMLQEPGPSAAEIDALLSIGARVPDHGKLGPWRFIIMAGEGRARAGEAVAAAMPESPTPDFERQRFLRAPLVIAVVSTAAPHPKIPEWEQLLSSGALCFNLLLVAHAMGYGGTWLTEPPTYDARARAALGLAEHERFAGFVYIGTANAPAIERERPDVASRTTWF